MQKEQFIIIGSGPAGLTAAIYAARAGLNPLVIDGSEPGGQLMGTTAVENWPGETSIMGPKLMQNMRDHATAFGTRFLSTTVTEVDFASTQLTLTTKNDKKLQANVIIVATGAKPKKLGISGEEEYWGKGVTTCAVCDGAFYKDRPVVIVGGGDTAMEDASFMTNFTKDITIIHILDKFTASKAMQERVIDNPTIKKIYNSTVSKITGNGQHITEIEISDQKTGSTSKISTDALFIAIGLNPNTKIFTNQLELTDYGHIAVQNHTKTSRKGVFAAGDVVDARYRQAITSAGTGCMAALDAEKYLKKTRTALK
jgi:thioredoxin reductase (NADPH)